MQEGLQKGAVLRFSNRGKNLKNWSKEISNRDRDYKFGQHKLQTRAGITNWCRTYESSNSHQRAVA